MRFSDGNLLVSATNLAGHLACRHLTHLERAMANGQAARPNSWDPLLQLLWERGARFEREYLDHLSASGLLVQNIDGTGVEPTAVAETLAAMRAGTHVVAQGALAMGQWRGRADILLRVKTPSDLGPWSYEPADTKLARETRAGAVLQLCAYAEMLAAMQGAAPEHFHIIAPGTGFETRTYRVADFAAYHRQAKRGMEIALFDGVTEPYPEPVERCDVCDWRTRCDTRRRSDDHLCLVAGISKIQRDELQRQGVTTLASLSTMPLPLRWKPDRGAASSYERVREQARVQIASRGADRPVFEMLPVLPDRGLSKLPEPSPGDVFFDLEGDPFLGEGGFEYLFGYAYVGDDGEEAHVADWAFDAAGERHAFEHLIDFITDRLARWPGTHVYHYAPYEPSALKRLMGRHATREEEVDRLLRGRVLVDLHSVIRNAVRVGVESYSLKELEALHGYRRRVELSAANKALARLEAYLELAGIALDDGDRDAVQGYNRDDCISTRWLRDWLESQRSELVLKGTDVLRPTATGGEAGERVTEWTARIEPVASALLNGVQDDPGQRSPDEHGRWLLANMLDWHRRELKAVWWEYFRLSDLTAAELADEKAALSGLSFQGRVGGTDKAPLHRYEFPDQDCELRGSEDLCAAGGAKLGSVEAVDAGLLLVDVRKRQDAKDVHPEAVFAHSVVRNDVLAESVLRLGEYAVANGLDSADRRAERNLLLRTPPVVGANDLMYNGETALAAACRIVLSMDGGILAIRGPPGTGKTFTGSRMAVELARAGHTVGVTANSHKVIRNFLDGVLEVAADRGVTIGCIQKTDDRGALRPGLAFAKDNAGLFTAIGRAAQVAGGTAWLWSRPEAARAVDVLFVDEAAQMSLANVLAVAQAARTVVLLGDPQQLDQPVQGSHPIGTEVSALHHLLAGHQTIPPDLGLFLDETWRLHPDICRFTSELFYEGRLRPRRGLERQELRCAGQVAGTGLRFLPVPHEGNHSSSPEEADRVASLVAGIFARNPTWVNSDGVEVPLTQQDVLVIAPYNAHAFELQRRMPGARVGTVDKFQGQQAPLVVYSMATSNPADAPRGMDFLYSLNRLNVATSRARCVCVLVANPGLLEPECRTPHQTRLANAHCRYLELATRIG